MKFVTALFTAVFATVAFAAEPVKQPGPPKLPPKPEAAKKAEAKKAEAKKTAPKKAEAKKAEAKK